VDVRFTGAGRSADRPIVVNGVLCAFTPTHKVIALDAATGARKWLFIAAGGGRNRPGTPQVSGGTYVAFALAD
jgi:glucose dehydrogenase